MTNKFNLILTCDSELVVSLIQAILGAISGIEISAIEKDIDRTFELIKDITPDLLILSVNRLDSSAVEKLKKINEQMVIIILSSNLSINFSSQWKEAGANYVFDLTVNLHNFIDVLCELLYQRQLKSMLSKKAFDNLDSSLFDASI